MASSSETNKPNGERVAAISPEAVQKARVYKGRVVYADETSVDLPSVTLVEIGKWAAAGEVQTQEDYLCTYYAATLLGFGQMAEWLPAGKLGEENRRLLITGGYDENGEIKSLDPDEAEEIASKINKVYEYAREVLAGLK